jgi:hypothetical protein
MLWRFAVTTALVCTLAASSWAQQSQAPQPDPPQLPVAIGNSNRSAQPLTPAGKLNYAIQRALLSPTAYLTAAAGAGFSMAIDEDSDQGYGMGGKGFARRFGDRFGTTCVSELTGSWIAASILRQDPRYFPSPKSGFGNRIGYAVSRVLVTRGDDGNSQFNASNLTGLAAGAGASIAWHRARDRSVKNYFATFGAFIGFDAASKLAKEFFGKKNKP